MVLVCAVSSQEKCRNFCSDFLRGAFSSGSLSGIISALLSALSRMAGLISLQLCSPACVMFLQKSTFTSSRLSPCASTPCRQQSVMRTQFSRWSLRSLLQHCSTEITSWSVMCAQPDSVSECRLGHLEHRKQSIANSNKAGLILKARDVISHQTLQCRRD